MPMRAEALPVAPLPAPPAIPAFIVKRPNAYTIKFGGRYINMRLLAEHVDMNVGYVSRILAGKRSPPVETVEILAKAFGMTLDTFVECVRERMRDPRPRRIEF